MATEGGGGGIRTHVSLRSRTFQVRTMGHYVTPPMRILYQVNSILTFVVYSGKLKLMSRILFKNGNQSQFLINIKQLSKLNTDQLALLCSVSPRTFRDWLRGKYTISDGALSALKHKLEIRIPKDIEIIDDYWYVTKGARKGALRRMELYGHLGTEEGRRKGGRNSQLRRRENPEIYKLLGCNLRKEFKVNNPSTLFAEAAGIILGDGGMTDNQLRITVSSLVDGPYATFIISLFKKVFGEKPSSRKCSCCNSIDLTISGVELIEELERWGFVRGDKIKHQVDFPEWIWGNIEFQKACVRGLMDTDGGCYFHKHKTNGLVYRNFGMCFANESLPLITSVSKILNSLSIKFSIAKAGTRIYIYSLTEIKKYFTLIGSNNPKNIKKFNEYLNENTHRILF